MLQSFILVASFSNFFLHFFSGLLNTLLFAGCSIGIFLKQSIEIQQNVNNNFSKIFCVIGRK